MHLDGPFLSPAAGGSASPAGDTHRPPAMPQSRLSTPRAKEEAFPWAPRYGGPCRRLMHKPKMFIVKPLRLEGKLMNQESTFLYPRPSG